MTLDQVEVMEKLGFRQFAMVSHDRGTTRHPKHEMESYETVRPVPRKAGLGVRSRNLWNGRWFIHVRFCSTPLRSSLRAGAI
jgi:hypothetical protein